MFLFLAVKIQVNNKDAATVTGADTSATNGVIHFLGDVLMPPDGSDETGAATSLVATTCLVLVSTLAVLYNNL